MVYALIKGTTKIVSIKESDIDNVNFTFTITSFKDEVYVEQYGSEVEIVERIKSIFGSSLTFGSTVYESKFNIR